ncbi:XRE family transcriptional regulator [Streptomyces sp. NPDC001832]|uniref:XRE family transcriptional regulator n=1 Tax=Streptomyces sp. NPDC001832 TaxID=3154527 RepID=UPI0033211666
MAEQDAPARTDLSDLVRTRRAELRLSLRRAEELGGADPETGKSWIKYSWIDRLEKGEAVVPPTLDQLKSFARALDLPFGRLQDAAGAQFFGIDTVWHKSGQARALVERADRMTPEQLDQLMRLLDTFAPPE